MLKDRIKTALILLPPVVLLVYWGGIPLILLTLVVHGLINYEFFTFATRFPRQKVLQLVALCSLLPLAFLWKGGEGLAAAAALAVLLAFVLHVIMVESEPHELRYETTLPAVMLGICYTGLIGSLLVVAAALVPGPVILWVLLIVVCTDTAAFFGGRAIGGAKLAPRISPNKTLSGGIVGLVGAVAGSVAFGLLLGVSTPHLLVFYGLLIGVLAVFGDLAESLVKRAYQVKDTGAILPGHGGMLDRVDALLFALLGLAVVQF